MWWGSEDWKALSARVERINQAAQYFHAFDQTHTGTITGQKQRELFDHLSKSNMIRINFDQWKRELCNPSGDIPFANFMRFLDNPPQ
jgi:hypothetical protein